MPDSHKLADQQACFQMVKEIIQSEDMWERVPEHAREFSAENLEKLVLYAYFGGFIDSRQVGRFLFLEQGEFRRRLLPKWYEDIRAKGCWLC